MKIVINLSTVKTEKDLHVLLANALHFPWWYGNNLDALDECLRDVKEPTEITFNNSRQLVFLEKFLSVFESVNKSANKPLFTINNNQ